MQKITLYLDNQNINHEYTATIEKYTSMPAPTRHLVIAKRLKLTIFHLNFE